MKTDKRDVLGVMEAGMLALAGVNPVLVDESRGAATFREKGRLPYERSGLTDEQLTALGFTLGERIDQVYQAATFPEGWKITSDPSDPRHMVALDEQDRRRASIFAKHTSYDYYANCSFCRRYQIDYEPQENRDYSKPIPRIVVDGGTVLYGPAEADECKAWLNEHYPNWEDASAYWDAEATK